MITPASMMTNAKRAGAGWVALHTADFTGLTDTNAYTSGPATGWTHGADWGYSSRVWGSNQGSGHGAALRFPVNSEQSGSSHSQFRCWSLLSSTYMSNNSTTTQLRMDYIMRYPVTGGWTRQDGGGYSYTFAAFASVGNGTRNHLFGVRTTGTLGIWVNDATGAMSMPATATTAAANGAFSASSGNWYDISVRIKIHASAGFLELWYGGSKICEYTGDTRYAAGSNTTVIGTGYFGCPGGSSSSNTDTNYFSGIDTVKSYKWA